MVVISAYFSGSETGMMTLNRYRLRHMAKQGNRSAKRVEKLLRKPDRLISLVLIGNNLVNILCLGARHDCGYAALRRRRRGYRHRGY
ncbi:hemolysin [Salmonella enterica subsp. enterica]|uniref:Hemolysin n=1 Tax=Salmonella enterica I TaxID=59201 RepID=A0A379WNK5_SALET|nr:hemolysin [Salmonella enterica subsp. enterica]